MLARIIINNAIVIIKDTKNFSENGSREDFVKDVIREGGVWSYDWNYFYPYHTIDKIEFREG